jgi:RibD C-terminal domain
MGSIKVHEFISLDGVVDAPTWTSEYGFHPRMGEALGRLTDTCDAILLGRTTFEMFEPAWSARTVEGRSRCAVLQRHEKVRRLVDAEDHNVEELDDPGPL